MATSQTVTLNRSRRPQVLVLAREALRVCKLRIGVTIAFTALAGASAVPGAEAAGPALALLVLSVLLASAAAGGFNQYMEADLDRCMSRTRARPFASGRLARHRGWLAGFALAVVVAVGLAAWATNAVAAAFVLLGALFYGVIYTLWLKRRTWLNIVLGGLAGSFALLAGAAAADPGLHPVALLLALVLFLWTPSHFWSLAIALQREYAKAGVPMLPVLIGNRAAARIVLANTVLLVTASVLPVFFGLGGLYLAGALGGGSYLLYQNLRMVRDPVPRHAMASFHASLVQLTLLLVAVIADGGF